MGINVKKVGDTYEVSRKAVASKEKLEEYIKNLENSNSSLSKMIEDLKTFDIDANIEKERINFKKQYDKLVKELDSFEKDMKDRNKLNEFIRSLSADKKKQIDEVNKTLDDWSNIKKDLFEKNTKEIQSKLEEFTEQFEANSTHLEIYKNAISR